MWNNIQKGVAVAVVAFVLGACNPSDSEPTKAGAEAIIDQAGHTIFVTFPVKEGSADRFMEIMKYNVEESRKEEGVLVYRTYRSSEDSNVFYNYEVYKDEAALDFHRETPHVKFIAGIFDDILSGPVGVQVINEYEKAAKGPE